MPLNADSFEMASGSGSVGGPTNCSNDITTLVLYQPSASVFLSNVEAVYAAALAVGTVATLLSLVLAVVHYHYARCFISKRGERTCYYWLIGLFPVATVSCLLGLFMPRSAMFIVSVAWIYLMVCLVRLIGLVLHLCGGRQELSHYLFENRQKISLQVLPCCCLCGCLPEAEPTKNNLRRVEWMVYQTLVVRILLTIAGITAVLELRQQAENFLRASLFIMAGSMLCALYGCHIISSFVRERLSPYRFIVVFRILDFSLGLFGIQGLICDLLIWADVYSCGPLLSPEDKSRFWNNFLLIVEMLFMSWLATVMLKPSKNAIFDRHPLQTKELHSETLCQLPRNSFSYGTPDSC